MSVWKQFGPILEKHLGQPIPVKFSDWRPGDQRIYVSDISKAQRELGWSPAVGIEEGIDRLFNCVKENKSLF